MKKSLVIDACCLLNLLASRHEVEIVTALGVELIAAPSILSEALYLSGPPAEDGTPSQEPVDLSGLEAAALFRTEPVDGPALESFIRCAEHLKDPDAAPVALAATFEFPLASDDSRQRNVARQLFPGIELVSTLELLYPALCELALSDGEMRDLAHDIRWRASFLPPKRDPHRQWFLTLLSDG